MNGKTEDGINDQGFLWDLKGLRLPRPVEEDRRGRELLRGLAAHAGPLWPGGGILVPAIPFTPALAEALRTARRAGRLVRGLEAAEVKLAAEGKGLGPVDRKTGVPRGGRVSRLLVVADDGAERFYRRVETLLRRNGPRVLALRLHVEAARLGEAVFGPGQRALLLLLAHKEAVGAMLLALAGPEGLGQGGIDIA